MAGLNEGFETGEGHAAACFVAGLISEMLHHHHLQLW
jgi:hypothetical protein